MSDTGARGAPRDRTHRTVIDYIDRTRDYYLMAGYQNPYAWAHFDEVPFVPLPKPLAACRVGLVTTAAPYQPDRGDQGPHAPYNAAAKFHEVYRLPVEPPPDLRIAHVGYDRDHTVPADPNAYFPLARLREAVAAGRIGALPACVYATPTTRSQRHVTEVDAPAILAWCREDAVDAAVLTAV
ncbi:MAG: hypothetical protein HY359_11405 [Candidatus Rokubacteria bacterium]|nr:hypothetical protein [Candidatus Rokubacteria bacterium]